MAKTTTKAAKAAKSTKSSWEQIQDQLAAARKASDASVPAPGKKWTPEDLEEERVTAIAEAEPRPALMVIVSSASAKAAGTASNDPSLVLCHNAANHSAAAICPVCAFQGVHSEAEVDDAWTDAYALHHERTMAETQARLDAEKAVAEKAAKAAAKEAEKAAKPAAAPKAPAARPVPEKPQGKFVERKTRLGTTVAEYHVAQAKMAGVPGFAEVTAKWGVKCETHGATAGFEKDADAVKAMSAPWTFCAECQKLRDAKAAPVAA